MYYPQGRVIGFVKGGRDDWAALGHIWHYGINISLFILYNSCKGRVLTVRRYVLSGVVQEIDPVPSIFRDGI